MMNIFVLDRDIKLAAQMHCDKHVIKQVLETAQILSSAVWIASRKSGMNDEEIHNMFPKIYRPAYVHHPCVLWAASNQTRWAWLKQLGQELCGEYEYRYGKVHKSSFVISSLCFNYSVGDLEPFVLAMPKEYKTDDAVQSYRNYYIGAKSKILKYTKRQKPYWIGE